MIIDGTGSGTLTVSGIAFFDGNAGSANGGGLGISGARVILEFCSFQSCSAASGGVIYVNIGSTQPNIYATSFSENTAFYGNDIYTFVTVTVHNSCPQSWDGTPTTGSSLESVAP